MPGTNPDPKAPRPAAELVIITGLSGSGKGSTLRALEDLGYYAVDNLPIDLIPKFAELTRDSPSIRAAALVVDIREGESLSRFPAIFARIRHMVSTRLVFLEAGEQAILRRFSETRRPHPLGTENPVLKSLRTERRHMAPIRRLADVIINTSQYNVHELRAVIGDTFGGAREEGKIRIRVMSFGFRHGIPPDSDLVFDVRFLPNPNYIPRFKKLTGRNAGVAKYIRSFPQTGEFVGKVTGLLTYLLPHYINEGKSYLTIAFGCTGGHHRSVLIADVVRTNLAKAGFKAKSLHRDLMKPV
jgi:UPF0042 nucleotide-binding protein